MDAAAPMASEVGLEVLDAAETPEAAVAEAELAAAEPLEPVAEIEVDSGPVPQETQTSDLDMASIADATAEFDAQDVAVQEVVAPPADATPDAVPPLTDVGAETGPTDASSPISKTGLYVAVSGNQTGPVSLHILAVPITASTKPDGSALKSVVVLHSVPAVSLPWAATVAVPEGSWGIVAALGDEAFEPESITALGFACDGGSPQLVKSTGASTVPSDVAVTVAALGGGSGASAGCGGPPQGGPKVPTVLAPGFEIAPPSTQAGGAHLLDGVWVGGALWVAGHQDAFVRFDFPVGGTPVGLSGWQPQGKAECSRIFHFGGRLWCTSRRPELAWAQVSQTTGVAASFGNMKLPDGVLADGLAAVGDRVIVAAHGGGLASMQADPPFAPLALSVDSKVLDPWDVAVVGPQLVAVADGKAGLRVMKVLAPGALGQLAHLPLPGLSAQLAVQGTHVAVTGPTGHLHVVDLAQPMAPKVLLAWQAPNALWGMAALPDHKLGVVAAGSALIAFDWPTATATWDPPVVRDVERAWNFALDVDQLGPSSAGQLLSSDFATVRTVTIAPAVQAARTLLLPKAVFAKATAVGGALQVFIVVRNLGKIAVELTGAAWHDDPKSGGQPKLVAGLVLPITVPAGGMQVVKMALPKTAKGVTAHELQLQTTQGPNHVQVIETTHLWPGDPLPKLAYQNAKGELIDVQKALAGKPGVVVVAAHACPMALVALSGLAALVGPWVAQGKVAVVAIDPWDKPGTVPQIAVPKTSFPVLYSPATTSDSHGYSALLQEILAQPANNAAPMPLVYVLDAKGIIVDARLGWEPGALLDALASLGVTP
ncbi:MAG: hypothetical protein FJ100_23175 [Deltaproteobacteria bacterium]|nr:hypothetical protein [Deltaproteobacteria bacterium]